MDTPAQLHTGGPLEQPNLGYPFTEYVPTPIQPCTYLGSANSPFHLLKCGHIIVLWHHDTRCGWNCLHVALSAGLPNQQLEGNFANNDLYCATCNGIPLPNFRTLHAENLDVQFLRPTCPLTTSILRQLPAIDTYEILKAVLSPVFHNPHGDPFDWKRAHRLSCGHEVWCEPTRPCASNCHTSMACRGKLFPRNETQPDAIICEECVKRADLVDERYAQAVNKPTAGGPVADGATQPEGAQN